MKPDPIEEEKRLRRERIKIRKLRREGKCLPQEKKAGMRRTIKEHKENAEIVLEFDGVKLQEWQDFVRAFERLWRGAAYLAPAESQALNEVHREVSKARTVFNRLERELGYGEVE